MEAVQDKSFHPENVGPPERPPPAFLPERMPDRHIPVGRMVCDRNIRKRHTPPLRIVGDGEDGTNLLDLLRRQVSQ